MSIPGEGFEFDERRVRVRNAQRWRAAEGFEVIGTTSLVPGSVSVGSGGGEGLERVIVADYLDGDWVISDLTPVNAPDGTISFSVLFKRA